jgi:hypothetical protein
MLDIDEFFCLALVNERDKNLFQLKRAEGKPEQFDKGRAGARDPVIDDLVAFFEPLLSMNSLNGRRMPGTP